MDTFAFTPTTLKNKNMASNSELHFIDQEKKNLSSERNLPMLNPKNMIMTFITSKFQNKESRRDSDISWVRYRGN
jgi:hypothetical protein